MSRTFTFTRRVLAVATAALTAAALGVAASPVSAAPTGADSSAVPVQRPGASKLPLGGVDAKLSPALMKQAGRTAVFVQLAGTGAADASAAAKSSGKGASAQASAAKSARASAKSTASNVVKRARSLDRKTKELYQVSNAVPGVAIEADLDAIRDIATRSDVVKVYPLVSKHPLSSNGSELTNVLKTWQDTGNYGEGVTVGIIDTGIDYTHADFGGPGTQEAWEAAHANNTDPNWWQQLPELAQVKIAGGFDFVGDNYNADPDADDYQPIANPDPDPIDCHGHGTHVAGITGGYGVNADGSPFTGDYGSLTSAVLNEMKIAPGTAPAVTLYGLKVFGCTGSTNGVIPAMDWALDPNGDGDFSDRLDIINMSLGSDYGTVDDPDNVVVDKLAQHGVLPVVAMGNASDITDIGGSPGNAVRSLAVASSVDDYVPVNLLTVDAPDAVAGTVAGQISQAYDWANEPAVTGEVVALSAANADGCLPLSGADAAAVVGKVAWLTWDSNDATRRCGSAGRADNVANAGAIGSIFTGDVFPFTAGILGNAEIPVFQLTVAATATLTPTVGDGLVVTFDSSTAELSGTVDPSVADTISSFSSRGPHGSIGVVKPDIAAPGDTIVSAGVGGGTEGVSMSGTSMATPHAAGVAALVVATNPKWTTEQVKANLMNTATHDVYTEVNQSGLAYGPARVGSGRIDASAAVGNTLLAYSQTNPGAVSVSFGPVEVPVYYPSITKQQRVTLQNTGKSTVTASLGYAAAVKQPGVEYSVWPPSVTLHAGQSTVVTVTMTITTAALRHTLDPTMEQFQVGVPRQYVSDASGWLTVQPSGGEKLRVPVYGAVKPVSQTVTMDWGLPTDRSLMISGWGVEQSGANAFNSLVSVMDHGATSPKLPKCTPTKLTGCTVNQTAESGDIQHVGAGATKAEGGYADGWLYFGISTYGDWATIGNSVIPYVDMDVDGDGRPDYEVYVQNYPGTDVLMAILVDLRAGAVIDLEPINFNWGDVHTNTFDNNVIVVPVWPALIGVTNDAKSFPITYTVGTVGYYTNDPNGQIDEVGPVAFDVVNPKVQVGSPLYLDRGQTQIPYTLGKKSSPAQAFQDTLILHLHGASGSRAEVLKVRYF